MEIRQVGSGTVRLVKGLVSQFGGNEQGSIAITDKRVLARYIDDPDFPFLVSFPRTGSHWLRLMMELYFGRPSLVRVFYFPHRTDYLTLHTHDMDLKVNRKNVIYLYRDPVQTVYSQMAYCKEAWHDADRVRYWARRYADHLDKWLNLERTSKQKTVVRYEQLRDDLEGEFAKITAHFGEKLDTERLRDAAGKVSKEEVGRRTTHDKQVVNVTQRYDRERTAFVERYSQVVWDTILRGKGGLRGAF